MTKNFVFFKKIIFLVVLIWLCACFVSVILLVTDSQFIQQTFFSISSKSNLIAYAKENFHDDNFVVIFLTLQILSLIVLFFTVLFSSVTTILDSDWPNPIICIAMSAILLFMIYSWYQVLGNPDLLGNSRKSFYVVFIESYYHKTFHNYFTFVAGFSAALFVWSLPTTLSAVFIRAAFTPLKINKEK